MKKRIMSLILVFAMIMTMFPQMAFAANTQPALVWRWAEHDASTDTWSENTSSETHTELNGAVCGNVSPLFFYFQDGAGNEIPLTVDQLASVDENIVQLSADENVERFIWLNYVGVGNTTITYTHTDGNTYEVKIGVETADFGFYTSKNAANGTYINEFTIKKNVDTFYLVAQNNWELTSVTPMYEFADVATITVDTTGAYAAIQITGTPENGRWYQIEYTATNTVSGNTESFIAGISLYDERPGLKFYWGEWHQDNTLTENRDWDPVNSWTASPNSSTDIFVYFVEDGVETRVAASELTSSNEDVLTVSQSEMNGDAVELRAIDFGDAKVNYVKNGITYTMDVMVVLPEISFYNTTTASKNSYINQFTVTDSEDTFYLVADGDMRLKTVTLDSDFDEIADVTIDSSNTFATIKVTGTPDNRFYSMYVTAEDTTGNRTQDGNWGIELINGKPSLMYRYPDWDNGPVENVDKPLESRYDNSPGSKELFFYFVESGVETRLSADDLTVADTNVLTISKSEENADAVRIESVDFGTTTINYVKDGVIYSINATIELPPVGLYSSSIASEQNYIREFTVTEDNDTFYLVGIDDWKLTDVTLANGLEDIATVTIDSTGSYASIQVTGTPVNRWYDVIWDAENTKYNSYMNGNNWGIELKNGKPSLMFCWPEDDSLTTHGEFYNFLNTAVGYSTDVWVYFVEGSNETKLKLADLKSSNEDVMTVVAAEGTPDMVALKTVGWGEAKISYTDANGKEYSFDVVSDLQDFGFYKNNQISKENWITEFTVTETENTFYLMANNDFTFDSYTMDDDLEAIAQMEMNADKTCAKFTITGTPEDGRYYGLEFLGTNPYGGYADAHYAIKLFDGRCKHEVTKVVDKAEASCTEDGYTGDTVCEKCEVVVEKGKVIAATGHEKTKVVDKAEASCTEDGYTGDTVCEKCEVVIEKGTVVYKIPHNYKDGVCEVCKAEMVVGDKVEDVDTSKPVEEVTPVVKQEAADTVTEEITTVVDAIVSENITEEIKAAVGEEVIETIAEAISNGNQITTEIVADVINKDQVEDVQRIEDYLGKDGAVAQYLNLQVLIKAISSDGEETELGTLNVLNEEILFTIVIPEELDVEDREYFVIRVHNGVVDKLPAIKNEDGSISFMTDRFSTYALAYEEEIVENPFKDVDETAFYFEPVLWAVENKITSGVSADSFNPEGTCTRGQVVTFLWRACGSPEPQTNTCAFKDVDPSAYYYKPVLWAVENKITSGISADRFNPEGTCTRDQVVTFLWRACESPEPTTTTTAFTDVSNSVYYYKPVLWAVENKVTSGASATKFDPEGMCTRGQVVTFLYRAQK